MLPNTSSLLAMTEQDFALHRSGIAARCTCCVASKLRCEVTLRVIFDVSSARRALPLLLQSLPNRCIAANCRFPFTSNFGLRSHRTIWK